MSIAYTCPGCGYQGKAKLELAGREGVCPKCKSAVRIAEVPIEVREHETAARMANEILVSPPRSDWRDAVDELLAIQHKQLALLQQVQYSAEKIRFWVLFWSIVTLILFVISLLTIGSRK